MVINFAKIEQKWQKKWAKKKVFEVGEDAKKKKYYVLEMFPYPSASYLHMGHVRNYTMGDIIARFKRMQGFNVLYPMGYDSFGLPAENAAKKAGESPLKYTEDAIKKIKFYQQKLGNSYDWSKTLSTHEPEYYKWNQYFFLKFLEKGLAYRKKSAVNWCPSCETVLANEEIGKGKCWRCESVVEGKEIEQWFLRTTAYADELLDCIPKLEWSERLKIMQENWIGKSAGTEILFDINGEKWAIFTTRPDTLFGVTFMVVSAQHPKLMRLVTKEQKNKVEKFLKKIESVSEKDIVDLEKEGVFTGSYAKHPFTGDKIPVWTGNFVVADYGSGMVMAVPAHDKRDFEFAKKYKIPIKIVINPVDKKISSNTMREAYEGSGNIINSEAFDDLENIEAMEHITKALEKKKLGRKTTNYKLRDWLISRQRYWGTPIPVIYCEKCGIVPVDEKDLPVLLPTDVQFGERGNPITTSKKFQNVKCPKCKGKARREMDTMGGFMDSSWYFLRYCDNKNEKRAFEEKKIAYWMPVDQYIGGIEHAVGHLIYSRFLTKALRDLGLVKLDEPFMRLFNQGVVYKGGKRMSKSQGNAVTQDEISKKYGIDSARLFLMFVASPESDVEWADEGVEGISKFVRRIFELKVSKNEDKKSEHYRNKFIRDITLDVSNFKFNSAIIKLMKWLDLLRENPEKNSYMDFLKILSVFAPHISEELWEKIGGKGFVSTSDWPKVDEKKIDLKLEEAERAIEKTGQDIRNINNILKLESPKAFIYVIPSEFEIYKGNITKLNNISGANCVLYMVNDKQKYDPQGKASKAKSGKPGIYVE